jgi:hypothetical protein
VAKVKKQAKKVGGPFLASAVFCESIMEDASGKVSAINILDGCQFWVPPQAPDNVPSKSQPVQIIQNILLIFRTGDAPGKHNLRLMMQQPNGKRSEALNQEIKLTPESHGGVNIKTHVNMSVYSSGVFWIDVILDGKRLTRMPLNISFQRLPGPNAAMT